MRWGRVALTTEWAQRHVHNACGPIDIGNALTAPSADLSTKGRELPDGSLGYEATMDMADVGPAPAPHHRSHSRRALRTGVVCGS